MPQTSKIFLSGTCDHPKWATNILRQWLQLSVECEYWHGPIAELGEAMRYQGLNGILEWAYLFAASVSLDIQITSKIGKILQILWVLLSDSKLDPNSGYVTRTYWLCESWSGNKAEQTSVFFEKATTSVSSGDVSMVGQTVPLVRRLWSVKDLKPITGYLSHTQPQNISSSAH